MIIPDRGVMLLASDEAHKFLMLLRPGISFLQFRQIMPPHPAIDIIAGEDEEFRLPGTHRAPDRLRQLLIGTGSEGNATDRRTLRRDRHGKRHQGRRRQATPRDHGLQTCGTSTLPVCSLSRDISGASCPASRKACFSAAIFGAKMLSRLLLTQSRDCCGITSEP